MNGLPPKLREALDQQRLPGLEGLRAVSVFLVIFLHFGFLWVPGGYGVVTFFVLSGFLITWLLLAENERTGRVSLRGFYRRRALRIFPAFYAYWILIIVVILLTGRTINWPHAWSAFFYVTNYYHAMNGDPSTGFSHIWSLAIEEQFYLFWPLAFLWLSRRPAVMAKSIALTIGAIWCYRALLAYYFNIDQAWIYAAFDTRADALLAGCLLAVLLNQGFLARFWAWVTRSQWLALLNVGLIALAIYLGDILPIPRYRDVFGFALVPPLIAVLLAQVMSLGKSPLWRWTEWGWVRYLGRISYGLYLYQQVTLSPVRHHLDAPVIVQLLVAIGLTILMASASYYVVERPFLRFKDRQVARTTRAEATP